MTSRRQSATDVARAILELDQSGLFDPDWYERRHEDASSEPGDLLVHFCNTGWHAGLRPNWHFHTGWYVSRNPEIDECGINPLLHYHQRGESQDLDPSPHFDVAWYRRTYRLAPGQSCLAHFLAHRRTGPTNPNQRFDAAWYLARYQAQTAEVIGDAYEHFERFGSALGHASNEIEDIVVRSGLFDADFYRASHRLGDVGDVAVCDLVDHFCRHGWRSGLDPNECFSTRQYLERNPDVREAGLNPLLHYIAHGQRENRYTSDRLDAAQYSAVHQLGADRPVIVHYLNNQKRQQALIGQLGAAGEPSDWTRTETKTVIAESGLFDENFYLINYPDVRLSGMDPLDHLCRFGLAEGRRPNAFFDTEWYATTYLPRGGNPLLHYILEGEKARNRPIIYFETEWYAGSYGIHPSVSPLLHYLRNRRRQSVSPNHFFDIEYYAANFAGIVGGNRDLFAHYLREGITRDINPNPQFDGRAYRARWMAPPPPFRSTPGAEIHEKIRRERLNPLVHSMLAMFGDGQTPSRRARPVSATG